MYCSKIWRALLNLKLFYSAVIQEKEGRGSGRRSLGWSNFALNTTALKCTKILFITIFISRE